MNEMTKLTRTVGFSIAALIFAAHPTAVLTQTNAGSPDDILIVANVNVPVKEITQEEVRLIFLKYRTYWGGGVMAVPIHASDDSELRTAFTKQILNMTAEQETSYWEEQKIRNGFLPPAEFKNQLKAVFKLNGAISYVYRSQYKEGVAKILLVLPK